MAKGVFTNPFTRRPLLSLVLCFGAGILLQSIWNIPFRWTALGTLGMFGAACLFSYRILMAWVLLMFSFSGLGFLYATVRTVNTDNDISRVARYYYQKPFMVKGQIISDVEQRRFFNRQKKVFTFKIKQVKSPWGWKDRDGRVLVNLYGDLPCGFGDELLLEGKLYRPFEFDKEGHFSYRKYLARKGIQYILSVKRGNQAEILNQQANKSVRFYVIYYRNYLKEILKQYLTVNEAGLLQAILLGDRSQLPNHIRDLFERTGTAHVLAISGLHIGIIVGILLVLVKLLPLTRGLQYGVTIMVIIIYAFLTGGRPSVVRAVVMAVIVLTSLILEKEPDWPSTVSLAAFILLIINPFYLFDIGFQLSFVCVLFIVLFQKQVQQGLITLLPVIKDKKWCEIVIGGMSVSLTAWLGAAGLIMYYFQIVTPIAVLANGLVVPLMTLLVAAGLGLLIMGGIVPFFAVCFAYCLKGILNVMIGIIFLFNKLPGAYFLIKPISGFMVAGFYFVLILGIYSVKVLGKKNFSQL